MPLNLQSPKYTPYKAKLSTNRWRITTNSIQKEEKLGSLPWNKNIVDDKIQRIQRSKKMDGHSRPCLTKMENLCSNQGTPTKYFNTSITNTNYNIRYQLNCKIKYLIYLMQCTLFSIQYRRKSQTQFNLRLNNHRNMFIKIIHYRQNRMSKFHIIT